MPDLRKQRHLPDARLLPLRDIIDAQLESLDGRRLGRVADLEAEWDESGKLRIVSLLVGPEAQIGAVSVRLRSLLHRLLKGRFEHRIDIAEVEEVGPTVHLRGTADAYDLDGADRWLMDHILRFIPGNGRE